MKLTSSPFFSAFAEDALVDGEQVSVIVNEDVDEGMGGHFDSFSDQLSLYVQPEQASVFAEETVVLLRDHTYRVFKAPFETMDGFTEVWLEP